MIDLTCILYLMEDVIGSFTTGYVVMYACIHLHNCINRLTETLLGRCRNFGTYHARRQYYLNFLPIVAAFRRNKAIGSIFHLHCVGRIHQRDILYCGFLISSIGRVWLLYKTYVGKGKKYLRKNFQLQISRTPFQIWRWHVAADKVFRYHSFYFFLFSKKVRNCYFLFLQIKKLKCDLLKFQHSEFNM